MVRMVRLKATEFLNLDAILEDVLVRLVLRPLWTHINKLFVDAYSANGSIQLLVTNMKYARAQSAVRLGLRVIKFSSTLLLHWTLPLGYPKSL
ncbi:hypothetical protein SK128_011035 [Halocaridina rubra]|uniref:Uncharacterized protein n=1 Tax=Halocaridina rubra TaxID=373956 RepID=A0AAN8WP40_HALRR